MRETKMKHRLIGIPLLCLALFTAACAKNGTGEVTVTPSENESVVTGSVTPSGEVTPDIDLTATVTPEATATPTSAPTSTPTSTPTITPTPTPAVVYGSVEQLRRNRELHEVIRPHVTSAPLGTAAARSDSDNLDIAYGIMRISPVSVDMIDLATGRKLKDEEIRSWIFEPGMVQTVHVSGLVDQTVSDRINQRIDEVVAALADPNCIPDDAGVITLYRERGTPGIRVLSHAYTENGFLWASVSGDYFWTERHSFATDDEYYEFRELAQSDDTLRCWDYTVQYADGNQPRIVDFTYFVSERTELLFNLASGDEVALSDLFPEGFDYLTYINDAIAADRYEYWFHSDLDHQGMYGNEYDGTKEYDGAGVFAGIDMNTQFSYYAQGQDINIGSYSAIPLPERVADPCRDRDVFTKPVSYLFSPLEKIYLGIEEYGLYRRGKHFGDVKVSSDGAAQTVSVFTGGEGYYYRYYHRDGLMQVSTFEKIEIPDIDFLAFVRDWAEQEWPKAKTYILDEQYDPDFVLRAVTLNQMEVYPNGYAFVTMALSADVGESDEDIFPKVAYAWMKDGKYISQDELFDVSCEELLEELLAGLQTQDGARALTAEEAKDAAKLLSEYIKYPLPPENDPGTYWEWDTFSFSFRVPTYLEWGEFPAELAQKLPKVLLKSMLFDSGGITYLKTKDPYVYAKHMRIYEGYSFDQ